LKTDKVEIENLLKLEGFSGKYTFFDFDPVAIFGSLRSLHGERTPYGILLLSDFVAGNEVLYLDSDLLVEIDVLEIENFDFQAKAIAAVPAGMVKTQYENDFFIKKLGLSPTLACFNSGVLLFNLKEWRLKDLKKRCLELATRFPNDLLSADQSVLNAIFAGNFSKLPIAYNCEWLIRDNRPTVADKMIIHFVGSPKPWDIFGSFLHRGYKAWYQYSHPHWERTYSGLSLRNLKRTWNLRRSYLRILKRWF
jgi:lipopolysaccharide biosynthesis glycosyltransferase